MNNLPFRVVLSSTPEIGIAIGVNPKINRNVMAGRTISVLDNAFNVHWTQIRFTLSYYDSVNNRTNYTMEEALECDLLVVGTNAFARPRPF